MIGAENTGQDYSTGAVPMSKQLNQPRTAGNWTEERGRPTFFYLLSREDFWIVFDRIQSFCLKCVRRLQTFKRLKRIWKIILVVPTIWIYNPGRRLFTLRLRQRGRWRYKNVVTQNSMHQDTQ